MHFDETAHVAAKLQRDFYSNIDVSARMGTPQIVAMDRMTAAAINNLVITSLSLDYLGLLPHERSNHPQLPFDSSRRDALSFALIQLSDCLNKVATIPSTSSSTSALLSSPALRKASSIPLTVQAVCDLLMSVNVAVNAVNDYLMRTEVMVSDVKVNQQQQQETKWSRPSSARNQQQTSIAASRPSSSSHAHETTAREQNEQTSATNTIEALQKELRVMKEREELMLKKIRDLEIDCRVKAHVVADTTASAQSVFDENTVLRQIAEHNQSLLKEIDALSRCVTENETLHMEISSKDKFMAVV